MPKRNAYASWTGTLKAGEGSMKLGSGAYEGPFSFKTRFENEPGTNPEELIGAALAGCFSMALAAELEKAGFKPVSVDTDSVTILENTADGPTITTIELNTKARVEGIDETEFQRIAAATKGGCPVSRALQGPAVELTATLL